MYPSRFRYEAPHSLDEAIGMLREGGDDAKVLAGGQSLVPLMKLRFASPALIVDINNLPGLAYHRADPDGVLRIGALCRHADLERSELLRGSQPTMAAAAPLIADPIVRNRGTLVGSLCHADPQGDWASVMTALGGSIVAQGPRGRRTIPVADFVIGPFQNLLDPDEIAVEAVVPARPASGLAATSSSSAGSATSPPSGSRSPSRPRGNGNAGRHRAHRRRRRHHQRHRGGGGADRQAADRRVDRAGSRAGRSGGPAAYRPPGQCRVQAAHGRDLR